MTRYTWLAATLLSAALTLPTAAAARCRVGFDAPAQVRFQGAGGNGYESFESARQEADFVVTIANDGEEDCNALLSVQRQDGETGLAGGGGGRLDYSIGPQGTVSTIVDDQTDVGRPPNALAITLPPGRSRRERLSLQIPVRQIVPSGIYSGTVLVRLLDADDGAILAERSLQLVTTVRSTMSVLLFDSGVSASSALSAGSRSRRMDFGTLVRGEEAALSVLIQANDDYMVRLSSPNHGAMTHVSLADQRVGYTVTFGGRPLDLSSGEALVGTARATSLAGTTQQLRVRIGDIGTAHAGRYEDELTITVLPAG